MILPVYIRANWHLAIRLCTVLQNPIFSLSVQLYLPCRPRERWIWVVGLKLFPCLEFRNLNWVLPACAPRMVWCRASIKVMRVGTEIQKSKRYSVVQNYHELVKSHLRSVQGLPVPWPSTVWLWRPSVWTVLPVTEGKVIEWKCNDTHVLDLTISEWLMYMYCSIDGCYCSSPFFFCEGWPHWPWILYIYNYREL